jgi:hypothetical protein
MGATLAEGMPLELFTSGEPRWLGVQFNRAGESEQPRALLVSVPYALKAADADTLGGNPLSAFVLADTRSEGETSTISNKTTARSSDRAISKDQTIVAPLTSGTPGHIAKFTSTTDLGNSVMIESNNNVGIGTASPGFNLTVGGGAGSPIIAINGASFPGLLFQSSGSNLGEVAYDAFNNALEFYTNGTAGSNERLRITGSGNIGIGTAAPAAKLDVAGSVNASGNVSLPNTTNASTGVITAGGKPFLHNFGFGSTFLGTNAGNFNMIGQPPSFNTGVGYQALTNNALGTENTAVGANALAGNGEGNGNTAVGSGALRNNIADGNTAIGAGALAGNASAFDNTAIGTGALAAMGGPNNTATGAFALSRNNGIQNTATGVFALGGNTTGSSNTALGYFAGGASGANVNTTGSNNTFIGYQAGPGTPTELNDATAIGANALVSASNTLVLGDPSVRVAIGAPTAATKLQVVGDIRVGTSGTNGCIQNFSGGVIGGTCSSDMRLKQNIEPFAPVLDKVTQLQPVSYEWKADEHPEYHFGSERTTGLIAQEVEKVFPNMVATDERGYKAVNYSQLPLLLLQALRELKAENNNLRLEMEAQRQQFQSRLDAVENMVDMNTLEQPK